MDQHVNVELIYFIRATNLDLIKIGSTSDFAVRFASMRAASPVELTVMGVLVCPDAAEREQRVLRQWQKVRAHHKWFHATPALVAWIGERTVAMEAVPVETQPIEIETVLTGDSLAPLATIEQIAATLGMSVPTIRRYVRDRDVPYVRVGRQLRFDPCEFAGLAR